MDEENVLVPATIRAVPTHGLEEALENYTRAVSGSLGAGGSLDIARRRAELANEWKRVQASVVYEMSWLGASPDRQQLACTSVVSRAFEASDGHLRDERLNVPRQLVCELFKQATPETPVDVL